jgi:hypothetical protein
VPERNYEQQQPLLPGTSNSTRLSISDRIAVVGILFTCLGVLVGLCQWLFPGTRIFRKKKTDDDHEIYRPPLDRTGNGQSSSQTRLDQELYETFTDDRPPQPYLDSIGDLFEFEDGWRDGSLDSFSSL